MKEPSNHRPTEAAERLRLEAAGLLDASRQASLGQFFTPAPVASLVASKLGSPDAGRVRLLDAGAGVGSLTAAAVEHYAGLGAQELKVVAWEVDAQLHPALRATLRHCARWAADRGVAVKWDIQGGDYIGITAHELVGESSAKKQRRFDAIITNPPYRKVNGKSGERLALMQLGLPITNLYTAFLALAAAQLDPGGVLAAITPRSFASGLYSAPFRHFFFNRVGIEQLHLFESRAHVFADADVLQENVIFAARRSVRPHTVRLSISNGVEDQPRVREVPIEQILRSDDPQLFLRFPSEDQDTEIAEMMTALPSSLEDLGIAVSTGKVVEFRSREHLRINPGEGTAALIRPNHLKNGQIHWPDTTGRRKPNALAINPVSEKLLLPNETYVLVKRMTAKEERKRVCAAVSDSGTAPGTQIAFENHLNVFHRESRGLPGICAHGLSAYLNSSFVDRYVRQFNGHTQVNATDLRHLRYPSWDRMAELGVDVLRDVPSTQEALDEIVDSMLSESIGSPFQVVA